MWLESTTHQAGVRGDRGSGRPDGQELEVLNVDNRAVEAVTPKATVGEGKFRGQVLGIPNRSLAAKPCAGMDSTVMGAEKTEERHGWGTDQ